MPQLGLGTWPLEDHEAVDVVDSAIQLGYRLIDTAENYANEKGVGQGIKNSGVARQEIFVTTKFNRQWHSIAGVRSACMASLDRLGLDYVDLFLIHWPNPDQDRYVEAFEGMLALREDGLVRAIGTSNFKAAHLKRLFDKGLCPQVNQIQMDPYHGRDDLAALHKEYGIVTETWRPLGFGSELLDDPVISHIAQTHEKSAAQIVLRWAVQQGFATIPKTVTPERMIENAGIFGFSLSDIEMAELSKLHRDDEQMLDADTFGH